ncbi:MAG: L-ribulose-5-phosphate 4-epimerase [Alistipes sp.]|jgi:L-ribulose-5-phosphate 4-epimerase|nr:L-ribulose-5-phosphate 4-epimerase [Alistipes sp.]MBQ5692319.1 L-ribulose-5-phosphate 4-epimerase [Alistipes sp.]MBQ5855391.1 L-ribulose-5-phosphate 4-epimerase [Alistipes sp.]
MLEELKKSVCQANLDLVAHGLVILTWGNVSAIDRQSGLVVIKPSGVSYDNMKPEDMVVVDLEGNVVEGNLRPSSDTPTHLEIYKAFEQVGSVVHTHSTYATAWAQACRPIPNLGTTHADTFHQAVPCTDEMTKEQIESAYEAQTGVSIVERFKDMDPMHTPAVLVAHHGPFTWGKTAKEAVQNSVILEEVAKMTSVTVALNADVEMNENLIEKHYNRKHGKNAYYGQK